MITNKDKTNLNQKWLILITKKINIYNKEANIIKFATFKNKL